MNFKHTTIAVAFAGLSVLTSMGSAYAAGAVGAAADYGAAVSDQAAQRTISIGADTKWVNVTDGETVRFEVGGQSFTWHFSTYPQQVPFALSSIAPAGINVGNVEVYVAPNPLYRP